MKRNPENAKVKGVDVRNPSIVIATERATKRGYTTEQIMKLTGMPFTVIQDIQREQKDKKVNMEGNPR